MIRFIRYTYCIVRFISTYDMPIRYKTFYTRYDMYRVSYDTDNYGCMEYNSIATRTHLCRLDIVYKERCCGNCRDGKKRVKIERNRECNREFWLLHIIVRIL